MIGCEKLCGRCDACSSVVWALNNIKRLVDDHGEAYIKSLFELDPNGPDAYFPPDDAAARRAIIVPAILADLLARALRGRELVFSDDPDHCWIDSIEEGIGGPFDGVLIHPRALTMPEARSALSRLLAAGLCSSDEALRLLEET